MDKIDKAIMDMLMINMGYKEGETVAIVGQSWEEHLGEENKQKMQNSLDLCERMFQVYHSNNVDTTLILYTPEKPQSGVDVSKTVYERAKFRDIIFEPTAFSITHTPFTKAQEERGARIASMPTFTLDMFAENGPMNVDYKEIVEYTNKIVKNLRENKFARVEGPGTLMSIEIDNQTAHSSDGLMSKPGESGNLPGAEAYAVPVYNGKSYGCLTVPKGWGGDVPLPYKTTFFVKDGKFIDVLALTEEGFDALEKFKENMIYYPDTILNYIEMLKVAGIDKQGQEYLNKEIKPKIFSQPGYEILAELGIGTNKAVTAESIKRFGWSPLLAEKIYQTAHFANGRSVNLGGINDVDIHLDWVVPITSILYTKN